MKARYERRFEPKARNWRTFDWGSGMFDTGRRVATPLVEGVIRTPQHLILVTLRGGAEHLNVTSECGHRYDGADRFGAVSFVPAHCERHLRMRDVTAEWGSIALSPAHLDTAAEFDSSACERLALRAFTNVHDPFVSSMVDEFSRQSAMEGTLDTSYCDAMSWALANHLLRKYAGGRAALRTTRIASWQLKRIVEYIDTHLSTPIRIADLAAIVSLSPAYFHRAFRTSTGMTPLTFINQRRIRRAILHLQTDAHSMLDVALRVGFVSQSHFTRTFRRVTGVNPSVYRRAAHRK
jgi:AraC family transcriptional regulator